MQPRISQWLVTQSAPSQPWRLRANSTSGSTTRLQKYASTPQAGGVVVSRCRGQEVSWPGGVVAWRSHGLVQATSPTSPPRVKELFRMYKLEVLQAGSASWRFCKLEVLKVGSASWFCKLEDGRMGIRQDGLRQDGPPAGWPPAGWAPGGEGSRKPSDRLQQLHQD